MSITNPNIYLITEQLDKFVPDDIKHKILLLLLGMDKQYVLMIRSQIKHIKFKYGTALTCGNQYEIRPQENQVQYLIMCEIRITQFDADYEACRRKANGPGGMRNIRKYMSLLDARFKKRYKRLF